MKTEAIKYLKSDGYRHPMSIFPLKGKRPLTQNGFKEATKDQKQIEDWWSQYPTANIGIPTGAVNGILVIDVDVNPNKGKYGDDSLKDLETELGQLPDTWECITGSGGRHLYFKYPEGHDVRNSASKIAKDIDIRANGGYIVAPPSIHPDTGQSYEWECGSVPEETPLAELPEKWLQRLLGADKPKKEESSYTVPETVSEGSRNDSLFRYGASLRAKSVDALKMIEMMRDFNSQKCHPALADSEVQRIYNSIMKYQAGVSEDEIMNSRNQEDMNSDVDLSYFHHFNDKGVATSVYDFRIYEYLSQKGDLFIMGGTPYYYRHGVYVPDMNGAQLKTAIRKLIYPQLIKSTTIDRVYRLFLSEADLQVRPEELNRYPQHWINFMNGFYDAKSRKMIPHDAKYRAINQIPHEYHPETELKGDEIDRWLQFIVPEADDRQMLLQYCGYCLTRDTRQQKFMILHGAGGSGKSTVIRMIETMIGTENISNISLKELNQRFASYGLLGKLLNSCADLEVSALEDTSIIKKILGEDSLRAEAKGKDAISFRNYAKLIFSTNELPLVISEKTNGFFRRLLILNMTRQPEQKKADYLEILQTEIDYFIQVSVKALEQMYQDGHIKESHSSMMAVQSLRNDSDTVEAWIYEECTRDGSKQETRSKLYTSYESYCLRNDRTPLVRNSFYRALRTKDYGEKTSGGERYFTGIMIGKSSSEEKTALSDDKNCSQWVEVDDQMELPFN